ncbi:hypothetical protein Caur_1735 [Chloroflexus aurantiacus J-10-fl]|uniref:Uncharacterized protein n=1 Tax=Chloroflexus aurantiacus (strain ATCC 29366 / DSM 635 / J-10-fl) TaxID=324602 RepID=A9WCG1_CHLAA|nr:hypothetical protein Caur_1735 [Chloroflexus aurantiacus J-10-fl]
MYCPYHYPGYVDCRDDNINNIPDDDQYLPHLYGKTQDSACVNPLLPGDQRCIAHTITQAMSIAETTTLTTYQMITTPNQW